MPLGIFSNQYTLMKGMQRLLVRKSAIRVECFLTYILGLEKNLGMKGNDFNIALTIFYLAVRSFVFFSILTFLIPYYSTSRPTSLQILS